MVRVSGSISTATGACRVYEYGYYLAGASTLLRSPHYTRKLRQAFSVKFFKRQELSCCIKVLHSSYKGIFDRQKGRCNCYFACTSGQGLNQRVREVTVGLYPLYKGKGHFSVFLHATMVHSFLVANSREEQSKDCYLESYYILMLKLDIPYVFYACQNKIFHVLAMPMLYERYRYQLVFFCSADM